MEEEQQGESIGIERQPNESSGSRGIKMDPRNQQNYEAEAEEDDSDSEQQSSPEAGESRLDGNDEEDDGEEEEM